MFGISLVNPLVTQFRLNGAYIRDGNPFRDNTADGLGVMSRTGGYEHSAEGQKRRQSRRKTGLIHGGPLGFSRGCGRGGQTRSPAVPGKVLHIVAQPTHATLHQHPDRFTRQPPIENLAVTVFEHRACTVSPDQEGEGRAQGWQAAAKIEICALFRAWPCRRV